MANYHSLGIGALDSILPPIGSRRAPLPIWDESQQMFITNQYTSKAGHVYYLGIRVCERFITVLHISLWNCWTYINEMEIYAFDGHEKVLVQKQKFDKEFYNENLIRQTTENMLYSYLKSQLMLSGSNTDDQALQSKCKELVKLSYCSMLNNSQTVHMLESVSSLIENKKSNN